MRGYLFWPALVASGALLAAPPALKFEAVEIATGLTGGYQVVIADMNRDGKPDLIALASGIPELVWYENPSWRRHVIGDGFSRMINLAAADVDGDGIPEIVLAEKFENVPARSLGRVLLLDSGGDPEGTWRVREIDRIPSSHRIRTARTRGGGLIFINAPLAGAHGEPPDYRDTIPVVYYDPRNQWQREVISQDLTGVLHGIHVLDWNSDGHDELLTASFEGLHLFERKAGGAWGRHRLSPGNPNPAPQGGSSDVTAGVWRGSRFLAALEPWHGHELAVYARQERTWSRRVIDATSSDGHAVLAADFDGDGNDEIVAAFRRGQSLRLYRSGDTLTEWHPQVLDDSITPAGCAAADLDGDGRIDLACIGSATANLKWYRNLAK
jgi:hypothetical protein